MKIELNKLKKNIKNSNIIAKVINNFYTLLL